MFCKLVEVICYKNFKTEIGKVYIYSENTFRKENIFRSYFSKEHIFRCNVGIDTNKLMSLLTGFIIQNESHDSRLTQSALKSIGFLNSKNRFMEADFDHGVFVRSENEHLFNYLQKLSFKLERIAENCQKWLIVDSHNEILELKNFMVEIFGLLLRSSTEKKLLLEFIPEIEIDGSDLLQLKRFSHKNFILYYVQLFFRREKNEAFKFVQSLAVALPILKSFFTILDWAFKFRHFGNLRFREDSRLMYLLISILCHRNKPAIDFVVKHYE